MPIINIKLYNYNAEYVKAKHAYKSRLEINLLALFLIVLSLVISAHSLDNLVRLLSVLFFLPLTFKFVISDSNF